MLWQLLQSPPLSAGSSANRAASTSTGVATSSGSVNTKGTWATAVASTSMPWAGFYVIAPSYEASAGVNRSQLLDIGVGAAASERVLVANVLCGGYVGGPTFLVPLFVSAGSRVAVRTANATASVNTTWEIVGIPYSDFTGYEPCTDSVTYGADTATSSGTTFATPGATNTLGAWTQLTASTTEPCRWLTVALAIAKSSTVDPAANYLIDIGVGGAGSEQVIIDGIMAVTTASEEIRTCPITFPLSIPVGTRIAARLQASVVTTPMPTVAVITYT